MNSRAQSDLSLRSVQRAVIAGAALFYATSSCMRVEVSYRDVGSPDAWRPESIRPDASLDAFAADAPRSDAGDRDAPRLDAPVGDAPLPTGDEGTRAVLASVGQNVILARLREFEAAAETLVRATERARSTLASEDRAAARDAWREAMRLWQYLEVVQVGPAGLPLYALGGRGLRDEIHPWPFTSPCRIDQGIVDGTYESADRLRTEPTSARGLSAVEYTLFVEGDANRCSASSPINRSGSWAALGIAEIERRRLAYAHSASILLLERARELRNAWEPAGEDFLGAFATAGAGSRIFPTARLALNGLSDAMFYIYKDVTDFKIGTPAGLYVDCPAATCPENVESPWADASLDHIRANLEGFREAYRGAPFDLPAPGIDDLLRARGAHEVDRRIEDATDAALRAVDEINAPLEVAVTEDAENVAALFRATRALADVFRLDVLMVLGLDLPNRVEGDND